jgi:activator of HSP90 ATPase
LLKNKELLLGEGLRTLGTPNLNQNIPSGYSPKNDIEAKKQSSSLNESTKTTGSTSTAATSGSLNGSIITEKDLSNLATFTSSVKELSAAVEKLAQSKIQISLAPTQHMVNITGADILSAIGPEIERVAMKNIRAELAKYEEGKQRGK